MKELVFALQFKGQARPVEGPEGKLSARTTASSQVWRTAVTAKGIQAKTRPSNRSARPALSGRAPPSENLHLRTLGCGPNALMEVSATSSVIRGCA